MATGGGALVVLEATATGLQETATASLGADISCVDVTPVGEAVRDRGSGSGSLGAVGRSWERLGWLGMVGSGWGWWGAVVTVAPGDGGGFAGGRHLVRRRDARR